MQHPEKAQLSQEAYDELAAKQAEKIFVARMRLYLYLTAELTQVPACSFLRRS